LKRAPSARSSPEARLPTGRSLRNPTIFIRVSLPDGVDDPINGSWHPWGETDFSGFLRVPMGFLCVNRGFQDDTRRRERSES
jgi:hypothetical protein